jgi:hypothetical protein
VIPVDEDEEQIPARVAPAVANRSQQFGEGMIHGQVAPPESLQQEAARYNASVPREYRPSGSLNGMAQDQYQATLGGAFATPNGSAMSTYQTKKFFEQTPE